MAYFCVIYKIFAKFSKYVIFIHQKKYIIYGRQRLLGCYMSNYFRKFLVLDRLSGKDNCTVKIESENDISIVKVEIFSSGFSKGNYTLIYYVFGEDVCVYKPTALRFELQVSSGVKKGFSAVLLDERDTPLLYGAFGESEGVEYLLSHIKQGVYDDEIIATENYYEAEIEKQSVCNQNGYGDSQNKNSPPKTEETGGTTLYENGNGNRYNENYYQTVKEKLDKIINSYERDYSLCSLIPNSDFVKINYDSDRFYSVGIVYELGVIKYVCYAVMGTYLSAPPELSSYCEFIPLSPYNPLKEGYYVIFQNAQTGEIVKKA